MVDRFILALFAMVLAGLLFAEFAVAAALKRYSTRL